MARTQVEGRVERAGREVRGAVKSPWFEWLARFGYAARGVVYAVVGLLAIQAAFDGGGAGGGGQSNGTEGAVQKIAQQSTFLLWLVAIGLVGYAMWRFAQAILDSDNKGSDAKGLVKRGAMFASGIVYAGLAWLAISLATGNGGSAGGGGSQGTTAELMSKPFGRWLVILAGVAVMIGAVYQLYRGWSKKFRERMKLNEMQPEEERLAVRTGQVGLIARGIVFLMTGWFLVQAGLQHDASEARGLGGALDTLARQPYGPWLLGIIALGLVAYGAFSFLEARYRRIVL